MALPQLTGVPTYLKSPPPPSTTTTTTTTITTTTPSLPPSPSPSPPSVAIDDNNNYGNKGTSLLSICYSSCLYDQGDYPYLSGPAASERLVAAKCIPLWLQSHSATRPLLCQSGALGWAGLTLVALLPRRSLITPTLPEALTTGPGSGLGHLCGQAPL
ncbi:RNA binding effector protein Scp160 [Aspergillus luchuensis]|uniref:RNA binding effector protein Scp160 n=1 Tax=Aspergillus kawachii TaxID=1069201 RepID=A0A146FX97_ASPKA|nr:RNA binding effector protein Scp160 [Aspergillus luchuensis]